MSASIIFLWLVSLIGLINLVVGMGFLVGAVYQLLNKGARIDRSEIAMLMIISAATLIAVGLSTLNVARAEYADLPKIVSSK